MPGGGLLLQVVAHPQFWVADRFESCRGHSLLMQFRDGFDQVPLAVGYLVAISFSAGQAKRRLLECM